jgi:hypothetical protein
MNHPFFTTEFLEIASDLFIRAMEAAESDHMIRRVELAYLPVLYVQLSQGPLKTGKKYASILQKFEDIVTKENITHLKEGIPDVQESIDRWRKEWQQYEFSQQSKDS